MYLANDLTLSEFKDRRKQIEEISGAPPRFVLYSLHGEGGIGKTRLILQAQKTIQENEPRAHILIVDLRLIDASHPNPEELLLRRLSDQVPGLNLDPWQNSIQGANRLVSLLNQVAEEQRVAVFYDTSEAMAGQRDFWDWMEEHLVGPLVVERKVQQVFAGRMPVAWQRFEIRRECHQVQLFPLDTQKDAPEQIDSVLEHTNPALTPEQRDEITRVTLEYSFGLPALSERIAQFLAQGWPPAPGASIRPVLCEKVVQPFIEQHLFAGIEKPWPDFLWWLSPLDIIDPDIIQDYLPRVAGVEAQGQNDFFFRQGVTRLRLQYTVAWQAEEGDCFYGVIGQIVRQCFKTLRFHDYQEANRKAAETYRCLASVYFKDSPSERSRYEDMAVEYERRAEGVPA
jgi:hypothetical protein